MTESLVQIERDRDIAILRLSRCVTNALDLDLVTELGRAVAWARHEDAVRGLVLASASDRFFCIGFDIPQLLELPRADFAVFYRAFNLMCLDLYTLPKPTAAAITGHATAGGCIVALCCDYRMIAEGRKLIGLNEIKLGVPVPHVADCILRQLVGPRLARDITDSGDFYPPETALRLGLVDEVLPLQGVVPRAAEKIQALGSFPEKGFAEIKRNRTEPVRQAAAPRLDETDRLFVDCWYSDAAREQLRAAVSRF